MRTDNLERWRQRIAAIPETVREDIKAVLDQNADEFMAKVEHNLPKRSGNLASTLRKDHGTGEGSTVADKELTVTVSLGNEEHPYGPPNEFGHFDGPKGKPDRVHVPAQPVFYPALRVTRKRLRGRMRRVIGKSVQKLGGDPPDTSS